MGARPSKRTSFAVEVDPGDRRLVDRRVVLVLDEVAQRVPHRRRLEQARGQLVQQRLEGVVVVAGRRARPRRRPSSASRAAPIPAKPPPSTRTRGRPPPAASGTTLAGLDDADLVALLDSSKRSNASAETRADDHYVVVEITHACLLPGAQPARDARGRPDSADTILIDSSTDSTESRRVRPR